MCMKDKDKRKLKKHQIDHIRVADKAYSTLKHSEDNNFKNSFNANEMCGIDSGIQLSKPRASLPENRNSRQVFMMD